MSYPHEVSNGNGEANGKSSRSHASVSPLISHGKDAHHELHGEENFHSGGHSHADARLQLQIHRWTKTDLHKPKKLWSQSSVEYELLRQSYWK